MKKSLNKVFIIMISSISFLAIACGQTNDPTVSQIRKGFNLNLSKLSDETVEYGQDSINNLFGKAIDKYESIYGACGKEVEIEVRDYSFYSDELNRMVSGLSYNYGLSCKVVVGLHPSNSCETAMILWHELYHCCQNESIHGQWVYDLFDLRDAWEKEKEC